MTPDELDAFEARHQPRGNYIVCQRCEALWPCASARTATALREAWAEVERLRRGEVDGIFTSVVHECCEQVARVRALCDYADVWDASGYDSGRMAALDEVRAALDGDT